MSESTDDKPEVPAPSDTDAGTKELRDDELEHVSGGIGLLVPAVQKVRESTGMNNDKDAQASALQFEKLRWWD